MTGRWADIAAATQAAITGGRPCAGGCRWPVHPAATVGADGQRGVYDRHPGCEPGGQQLRAVLGRRS